MERKFMKVSPEMAEIIMGAAGIFFENRFDLNTQLGRCACASCVMVAVAATKNSPADIGDPIFINPMARDGVNMFFNALTRLEYYEISNDLTIIADTWVIPCDDDTLVHKYAKYGQVFLPENVC